MNLGVIGVTLAGEGCKGDDPTLPAEDQPQPVIVTTDDPDSAPGKTAEVLGVPNLIRMSARATKAPFAQAITTVAPIGDPAGVVDLRRHRHRHLRASCTAGTREAKAVTEIGEISFFNGLLTLQGLRWEAIQRTGGTTTNAGTFTLGSLHLAGTPIPLPTTPSSRSPCCGTCSAPSASRSPRRRPGSSRASCSSTRSGSASSPRSPATR